MMKKNLLLTTVLLLSFIPLFHLQAQSAELTAKIYQHLESRYGIPSKSVGALHIRSRYISDHNGVEHIHLFQSYQGIEILGTGINIAMLPDGRVISAGHQLRDISGIVFPAPHGIVKPSEAIGIAALSLGQTPSSRSAPGLVRHMLNEVPVYDKTDISLQDIPIQQGYLLMPDGQYKLVHSLMIESVKDGLLYQSYVDANSGQSVTNDLLTMRCRFEDGYLHHEASCSGYDHAASPSVMTLTTTAGVSGSYRALPPGIESPIHGGLQLLTDLAHPEASPYGWHDTNGSAGAEFTHTRGNNVHAFLDRNWDYSPDVNVDGGPGLVFDFPYSPDTEPEMNQNVAVTNLFVWNNIMHDFTYKYGFTEQAGNFQAFNYTGLGTTNDFVNAHAQFGDNNPMQCGNEVNGSTPCLNNADFSTPPDGFNGRMRMFTWDRDNSSKFLDIIEPFELSGKVATGSAEFGAMITTTPVTGEVVLINDGTFNGPKGCNAINGQPLLGKIALIERGLCDFSLKVYNAQLAGAVGAIIANFENATIGMGAGQNAAQVTIPSVFISSAEYDRLRVALGNGLVASLVSPGEGGPTRRDGSLDNSVIAHEYGHGISTRLTGGPFNSGCLSPGATTGAAEEAYGMGEGWSDFFALATTAQPGDTGAKRRGIGTFANKEPTNGRGIRTYPYSTDMSINPHTYDNILLESVPHGVGSVWSAMLWDLYWAFSDTYGWDPDLYGGSGGNNMAIQLVMDGLKLQGCNPGFIDARNAILLADTLNHDAANACLIWSVFARRGLGANADGGNPSSRADGREGFELPTSCRDDITFTKSMTPEILAGDVIEVTLRMTNYKDFHMTNVFVEDPIPAGCTYIPGSASIPPIVGNSLVWNINSIDPDESVSITYLLQSDQAKNSIRIHYDDIEGFPEERWDIYFDPNGTVNNFWFTQDLVVRSGVSAWGVGNVATESEHFLENFIPFQITGAYPVYRFYHYYDTETGADGGFLEISADNGSSWIPLEQEVFRNGYPRKLQYTTFAIPNLYAFTGKSADNFAMTPVYVDLSDYNGQAVKIRYRFGTDDNTPGDGWYVDDVEIMDAVIYNSTACVSSDQTDPVCADAPERGTIVDSQITISTDETTATNRFALMPNPAKDLIQIVMTAENMHRATIGIYTITGQLLSADTWNVVSGINQKAIDISRLTPGMYIMQIMTSDGMRSEKFIRE